MLTPIVLITSAAQASDIGHEIVLQVSEASFGHYLDTQLFTRVGDDRSHWGAEHDLARDNITAAFESFGLDVQLHPFEFYYNGNTCYNVVATQLGTLYPDAQFIVGAHYDSVGNPGADDDASGVTALLEIARTLSLYQTEYTIKYIAFDLEEWGLLGSEAYVADHLTDDIRGMVQLDMIARNNGTLNCRLHGSEASDPLKYLIGDAFVEYVPDITALVKGPLSGGSSDHASFESAGFLACLLIEQGYRFNPNMHTARDTVDMADYIDYNYAIALVRGIAGFLADNAVAHYPYDCDGDGVADETQIQNEPSLDCNGNHILDTCEFAGDQDLNGNGVLDICDIYTGASADCNGNWIPDEVEPGYGQDCNGNGEADFCDLATHVSTDLNWNSVPDECELHGTIYVDDDAPNDPGPNDPNAGDPAEDGSVNHPFDTIGEAVALSVSGDEIQLMPGIYSGPGNRSISFGGRHLTVRGQGAPDTCVVDPEGSGRGFYVLFLGESDTIVSGISFLNGSSGSGGALLLDGGSPTIVNCVFETNTATYEGGAIDARGAPTFVNCLFRGNAAGGSGGGQLGGGAISCFSGLLSLRGCVFAENTCDTPGGALDLHGASAEMANCVFWNNYAPNGAEIAGRSFGNERWLFSHNDIAGGPDAFYSYEDDEPTVIWGPGNIDADPLFVDQNNGDLHLLPGSPCIDAGGNAFVPPDYADLDGDGDVYELTPLDLDYEGRFFDDPNTPDTGCGPTPIVDMGAYEFGGTGPLPCVGDLTGDRVVSLHDIAEVLGGYAVDDRGDLDCDGDTDLADLRVVLTNYGSSCP